MEAETDAIRRERMLTSLEGLSVGDAFGETFFSNPEVVGWLIEQRALSESPWPWTDDTAMALSIVHILQERGTIDEDALMADFARRYQAKRGYGPAMHDVLRNARAGLPWREEVAGLFDGCGSYGNGAAMRVAPLGAYFADDLDMVAAQAARSATVTHTHPEGIAGAIAIAIAAALACRARSDGAAPTRREFIDRIVPYVPDSHLRSRIRLAKVLPLGCSVQTAITALGNGSLVSAQDTVPFCLWCAGECFSNYEEALWKTVSGLGDRDTTCAIVGGIVACYTGIEAIPSAWRESREPLPQELCAV